tara:strand:- start:248 stop:418 length:171 start_codon:yes stop_codon:yes gene_type:complete
MSPGLITPTVSTATTDLLRIVSGYSLAVSVGIVTPQKEKASGSTGRFSGSTDETDK